MSGTLRFGYVETAHGQIHYRAAGLGEALTRAVVLLHWTPGSSAQYDAILHEFARQGYRAFAPDLPGYGSSAGGAREFLVEDFAAVMLEATQMFAPLPYTLVGGHLSAEIAAQMAVSAPARIAQLIIDGSPTWPREFRLKLLKDIKPTAPVPVEDGSHLVKWWQHILWEMRMWQPDFTLDARGGEQATRVLLNDLQGRFEFAGLRALAEFEMADCLPRLTVPTLALTAATDPLRDQHDTVLGLVPDGVGHEFPGNHPVHDPARAAEYVKIISEFIAEHPKHRD